MTNGPLWLDWDGCRNVRDLAGVAGVAGGTDAAGTRIRRGALVRSDSHCFLTDPAIAAIRAYGVSRIIDLRRTDECETWPSRFAGDPVYRNLPLQDPSDSIDEQSMTARYVAMLDQRPELFAAAVRAIADAPTGAVVVQCAAGKDRTGLVVALVLALAGIEAASIAADYALSDEAIRRRNDEMLAGVVSEEERARWRSIRHARPETMLDTLAHLDQVYGGARGYLTKGGLDTQSCDTVSSRLLEAANP